MRHFIVALVVSLCWLHQDWFIWPMLEEFNDQKNFLSWLYVQEHELEMGIPAGLGFQVALSFATAAVWFLAVWKAWPTELENWADAGESRRGGRNRRGRNRNPQGENREARKPGGRGSQSDEVGGGNRPRRRRGGRGRRGGHGNSNPPSKSK